MHRIIYIAALSCLLLLLAGDIDKACSYVGPGPGMTVLGALWAVIAAVVLALFVIIKYPFKHLLKKMRGSKKDPVKSRDHEDLD